MSYIDQGEFKSDIRSIEKIMLWGRNGALGAVAVELAFVTENVFPAEMLESAANGLFVASTLEVSRHIAGYARRWVENGVNSSLE